MLKTLRSFDLKDKRVLIRVDFNVPVEKDRVIDDFRIRAALNTIKYCLNEGSKVVLMSHLGRPTEGEFVSEFSMQPVADYLTKALGQTVALAADLDNVTCVPGQVVLLENVRFNAGEKKDADDLADQINKDNPNSAKTVQGNLDIKEDVQRILSEVSETFPSIDVLVNNASTFYPTPIDEISEDHWERLIGSNLKGPLFLIQGLKEQLKSSKGSIINITDTNLSKGVPNFSIYSAAKAGLEAITKGLARELAPDIKVNAIAPGAMLEPPDVTWTEEQKNKVIENIPLNRMGSEKDIADAVSFLARSEYITGLIIKVDGGRSL